MSFKTFGEIVRALDVERLPEDTGPTHFVRVCGALIRWALVEHGAPSAHVQIAERLTVPDRGVDAQCTLPDSTPETGGFIGPGTTVFQFKYRDVGDRPSVISTLVKRLRLELARLPAGCDRYVLMTNVHMAGAQASRLRTAIVDAAPGLRAKPVLVWGASEIANALNGSVGLRHLFAAAGGLSTVEVAEAELKTAYSRIGWAPLLGRVRELATLREFVRSDTTRVLVVRGPQFSGRTRLVLEAVKDSAPLALWAVAAERVDVDLLRDLDGSPRTELIVVDDDRDEAATRRILDWAQQRERLKVIVIARGEPRRLEISEPDRLDVPGLERSDADALLRTLAPALSWGERSWIVDGSDGLPGLIAHAAALLPRTRLLETTPPDEFRRRLGELLTERYEAALSADERRALQIASLLPSVGVEGSAAPEIAAVARSLGLDPNLYATHRLALERAGLLRHRGRFVEVVPPLLAEHLASQALTNPELVIAELLIVLPAGRFPSLLERLVRLPGEGMHRVLERVLRERCSNFEGVLREADMIRMLAPAAPRAAMRCIENALKDGTAESLTTLVKGDARRNLVWALEDLALKSETFESAAAHLLLLAEGENESYGNNATGVFLRLFRWWHPEVPASLSQRLAVLQRGVACDAARRREIVAMAGGAAFTEGGALPLHHPRGPQPPEPSWGPIAWEELAHYGNGILALLRRLLRDPDTRVRSAAVDSVASAFRPLILVSLRLPRTSAGNPSESAANAVGALADVAEFAESAKTYELVASTLEVLRESLRSAEDQPFVQDIVGKVKAMHRDLERSFRGRLWRLIGPMSWDQRRRWRHGTRERQNGIAALARHFVDDEQYPARFETHRDWLVGSEARSGNELLTALGRLDTTRGLLSSLLAADATPTSAERVGAYLTGWAEEDRDGAAGAVDRLLESRPDVTRALLTVLPHLFGGRDLVDRVCRLLAGAALTRHEFALALASLLPWEAFDAPDVEAILTVADDGTPQVRGALLFAFTIRLMRGGTLSPSLQDLAWSFLESTLLPGDQTVQLWWDHLAAQLGKAEPARLLGLIEKLALAAGEDEARRMSRHLGAPLSLENLRDADRPGLIRLLLRLSSRQGLEWNVDLEEEVDPLIDRDALLAFARETGVEGARTVALNLTAERPGFWEVARDLLVEWGDDDVVRQRLLGAVSSATWWGSAVPTIQERLGKVAALRSDPHPQVATWAQQAMSFFDDWRRSETRHEQEEWIWDYHIRRAELEGMVNGPDSPDKLWAIGRLLEHAPQDRVRELLMPREILDALDQLPQLPERVRERWEAWAQHWVGRRH